MRRFYRARARAIRSPCSFELVFQRASLFAADSNGYVRDGRGKEKPSRSPTRLAVSDGASLTLDGTSTGLLSRGGNTGRRYRPIRRARCYRVVASLRGCPALSPTLVTRFSVRSTCRDVTAMRTRSIQAAGSYPDGPDRGGRKGLTSRRNNARYTRERMKTACNVLMEVYLIPSV